MPLGSVYWNLNPQSDGIWYLEMGPFGGLRTHSSTLAQRILWTEEPGGLLSMGSHRVGHDWSDLAAAAAAVMNGISVLKKETPESSLASSPHEDTARRL